MKVDRQAGQRRSQDPDVVSDGPPQEYRDFDLDPLDAAGNDLNWLTGVRFSPRYYELARMWAQLPVYADKSKLRVVLHLLHTVAVSVILSGTGSGKTMIVPKLALKYAVEAQHRHVVNSVLSAEVGDGSSRKNEGSGFDVVVTNPKKSITENNAAFIAQTLDVQVGDEVGYAFRGAPRDSHGAGTRLLFTTDGFLTAMSRNDPTFSRFSVVIVDEAHERTVYIDTLLFMLRRAVQLRPELRVVIISATIDPALFTGYFSAAAGVSTGDVYVSGINHPVEEIYLKEGIRDSGVARGGDYIRDEGMRAVDAALKRTSPGEHTLFFVPTVRDAERGCLELAEACRRGRVSGGCRRLACNTLYAKLNEERQKEAISQAVALPHDRKIVFGTNVAESSLTIKNLVVVIDSGLELDNSWVPELHCSLMQRIMSTQAQMNQRKGRVGRTRPGVCYRLYSEDQMRRQPEYPAPAILTVDLTDDVLTMARDERSVQAVARDFSQFITPPKPVQLAAAASVLVFYRLIAVKATQTTQTTQTTTKAAHFSDLDFRSMASADYDYARRPLLGNVTPLGRLVLDLMRRCKLGAWNALLIAAGLLLLVEGSKEDDDSAADDTVVEDLVILSSILEETGGDPALLWYDETKADVALKKLRDNKNNKRATRNASRSGNRHGVRGVQGMHATSEHASLVALFLELTGERRKAYVQADVASDVMLSRILRRIDDTRGSVRAIARKDRGRLAEARRESPLVSSLSSLSSLQQQKQKHGVETTVDDAFVACVIWARLYHAAYPSTSQKKEFATVFTLRPLRFSAPANPAGCSLIASTTTSTTATPETSASSSYVVLYDTCGISSRGVKPRVLTYVPENVIESLQL